MGVGLDVDVDVDGAGANAHAGPASNISSVWADPDAAADDGGSGIDRPSRRIAECASLFPGKRLKPCATVMSYSIFPRIELASNVREAVLVTFLHTSR